MRTLWCVGLCLVAAPGFAGAIEVWTRPASGEPKKQRVDAEALQPSAQQLKDPQYHGEKRWYRAVPLEALFKAAPATGGANLALLRFENGMAIPVHFTQAAELTRLKAWVAVATSDKAPDKGGAWSSTFQVVAKPGAEGKDPKPLTFSGNKLVVESAWHPMVAADASATFNPWWYADTLVAIEYVGELAWYGQFDADDPAAEAGVAVFRGRCQFCHGVNHVGASYGWDYVDPIPVYQHRSPSSLAMHVRHREQDAAAKGLMMPGFPEVKKADVESMWKWLEAMGTKGLKPYKAR